MEWTPGRGRDLRPLGIGEVLDRAVTLSVRYFLPLALAYVVIAVPQGVIRYFVGRTLTRFMTVFASEISAQTASGKRGDPQVLAHQLAAASPPSGWVALFWIFAFLISPLAVAALVEMTSALYFGRPTSFVQAYRAAFARYLPLLGVNLIFIVSGIFLYVVFVFVVILLGLGVAFLYVSSHPLGLAIGIPLGLALTIGALGFAVVVALALQVAYFTCVIERASSAGAFTTAVSRVFGKIGLPRALSFGAAYLAIAIVLYFVALGGDLGFSSLLHSDIAAAAYVEVVGIVSSIFATAFVCVFYYDLARTRRRLRSAARGGERAALILASVAPGWPGGDPDTVVRRVLAEPGFAHTLASSNVAPQRTFLEIVWGWLMQHVFAPLLAPLAHAFSAAQNVGTVAGVVLVVVALVALGFVIVRLTLAFARAGRRAPGERAVMLAAGVALDAAAWRARASDAAGRADYALAIAALWMAALCVLDERALVTFDPARTPGEYNRLVRRSRAPAAVPFASLGERFVYATYARARALPADYDAALAAFAAFEPAARGGV